MGESKSDKSFESKHATESRPPEGEKSTGLIDESGHNAAVPSRRRLMRALGGAGATALGSTVLSGWQKPVVESVLLPAHAVTTGTESPDPSCPYSATIRFAVDPPTASAFVTYFHMLNGSTTTPSFAGTIVGSAGQSTTWQGTVTGSETPTLGASYSWSNSVGVAGIAGYMSVSAGANSAGEQNNLGFATLSAVADGFTVDAQCQLVDLP